jgi:KDO2-lipid IV(A) lauroyltransferase
MSSDRFSSFKFAPFRVAAAWLGYSAMRAVVLLPLGAQLTLGKALGRLLHGLATNRRRVVERNLAACFPELDDAARAALARAHFRALGASLVEMSMGWFGDADTVRRCVRVEGADHLAAALERRRGVILFSAHFTTFELFWPALKPLCPRLCGMYKEQRNPVMNRVMTAGRRRSYDAVIAKTDVRGMLRELARNSVFWYASDQSYGGKGAALIPFFGVPAMTNTAIGRIARMSGAAILPYFCRRMPGGSQYVMTFGAPLENLPSGDDAADVRRLVALLETYIRSCPEQYWWIHQRFKGRPTPYPDLYRIEPAPLHER